MIPHFETNEWQTLPPGIHWAAWDEVVERLAMIANELEYKITKSEIAKFEEAIRLLEANQPQAEPWMIELQRGAMQSQLEELKQQVVEYEQLRGALAKGSQLSLKLSSLAELPNALIRARIAKGWTQAQLAERLGVRVQQVQNDEATLYQSASFSRLKRIAQALGADLGESELRVSG
jgi:HTH-type transcriptional regulator/antitoxin HigA